MITTRATRGSGSDEEWRIQRLSQGCPLRGDPDVAVAGLLEHGWRRSMCHPWRSGAGQPPCSWSCSFFCRFCACGWARRD